MAKQAALRGSLKCDPLVSLKGRKMSEVVSKRAFSVAPAIVMHLIKSQAGTLAKAVLEAVQNAIDAGATRVDVNSSATGLVITDNGRGFQSKEEIAAWFDVFGFEHEGLGRQFGAFGIGRGQMWAYASTAWRTQEFEMRVDVRKSGLDYELVEGMDKVPGLRIEAQFYEQFRTAELLTFDRELEGLCEFAQIPVKLNGKLISKDITKERWTHETDDAYIRLSDSARQLAVYNLGVFVSGYSSYYFGVGGVVVTKKRLDLNMARSDVLQSSCAVFKRIKPFLQRKADERVKRSEKLSEDQMANLALRFLAGELEYGDVSGKRLISDMLGRKMTIGKFMSKAASTTDATVTVVGVGEKSAVAEQFHKGDGCFVLGEVTLGRFGAKSVRELVDGITHALRKEEIAKYGQSRYEEGPAQWVKCVEDWRDACKGLNEGYEEVPTKDWTQDEMAAMAALEAAESVVRTAIGSSGCVEGGEDDILAARKILLGVSDVADAWTNGKDRIWINRTILPRMKSGIGGVVSLVGVLVHEYLHQESSSETHAHDLDFYERVERVMLHADEESKGRCTVGNAVETAMRDYAKQCAALKVRGASKAVKSLDHVEAASMAVA
jgi:hypothetical protein